MLLVVQFTRKTKTAHSSCYYNVKAYVEIYIYYTYLDPDEEKRSRDFNLRKILHFVRITYVCIHYA